MSIFPDLYDICMIFVVVSLPDSLFFLSPRLSPQPPAIARSLRIGRSEEESRFFATEEKPTVYNFLYWFPLDLYCN